MKTSFPTTTQWQFQLAQQALIRDYDPSATMRRPPDPKEGRVRSITIRWARSIPSQLRPRSLVIKFPRVANMLAETWDQPRLFNMYLCQLMADDRHGERQGFPPDVQQDLENVREHFNSLCKRHL